MSSTPFTRKSITTLIWWWTLRPQSTVALVTLVKCRAATTTTNSLNIVVKTSIKPLIVRAVHPSITMGRTSSLFPSINVTTTARTD